MMRLHDMSGPAALETLCEIIDPASVILEDRKTADALAHCANAMEKPMPALAQCMVFVKAFAPVVKAHQKECFTVAAVLLGKPYDEVCKQSLLKTIKELRTVWNEDLRDFFSFSADTEGEK